MAQPRDGILETYTNPVYKNSFPDPFVLKFKGEYFAYCTGISRDGRVFGVLRSADLVNWIELPGAMHRLPNDSPHYWAPEVTYHNGKFYLYYSVGNETIMEIRVAVSDKPHGDFVDSGKSLTNQDFAIDAHVYRDTGSKWYMFYATDFLNHSHIGTGTVVDRMIDPFTLEGNPRPVTRARYDWQVYDPNRAEKGNVRWHTVEGPFVLQRKGTYFEMFSGGNWQNLSYGVSFATTQNLHREDEWNQFSDGEKTLPILRTVPGRVFGPGHNSVVRGPNNRELFCIYHNWVDNERVLSIDRMDIVGSRIFIAGPSDTPRPVPFRPRVIGPKGKQLKLRREPVAFEIPSSCRLEFSFRASRKKTCIFGCALHAGDSELVTIQFIRPTNSIQLFIGGNITETLLPTGFDFEAVHEAVFEIDHQAFKIVVDQVDAIIMGNLPRAATDIRFFSLDGVSEISDLVRTDGFEDLFEDQELENRSWILTGNVLVENQFLVLTGNASSVSRPAVADDFELCVNFSLGDIANSSSSRFVINCGAELVLEQRDGWVIKAGSLTFKLPASYDPGILRQLRLVNIQGEAGIHLEDYFVGALDCLPATGIKVSVENTSALVDMIRFTIL